MRVDKNIVVNSTILFTVLAFAIAVTSCTNSTQTNAPVDSTASYDLIKRANWLIGEWQNVSPDAKSAEIWEKKNDSTYSGISYVIVMSDTVFYETITIEQRGNDLFYIPTVSDQNNAQPVEFKLISSTRQSLTFENALHDFPQKISYSRSGTDSVVAVISGRMEGKYNVQEFPMERVK